MKLMEVVESILPQKPFAVLDFSGSGNVKILSVHKVLRTAQKAAEGKKDVEIRYLRMQVKAGETIDRGAAKSLRKYGLNELDSSRVYPSKLVMKVDFIGDGFVKDNVKLIWPGSGAQHLNLNNMSAINGLVNGIIKEKIAVIWVDKKMPDRLMKRFRIVVERAKKKGHSVTLKQ